MRSWSSRGSIPIRTTRIKDLVGVVVRPGVSGSEVRVGLLYDRES